MKKRREHGRDGEKRASRGLRATRAGVSAGACLSVAGVMRRCAPAEELLTCDLLWEGVAGGPAQVGAQEALERGRLEDELERDAGLLEEPPVV